MPTDPAVYFDHIGVECFFQPYTRLGYYRDGRDENNYESRRRGFALHGRRRRGTKIGAAAVTVRDGQSPSGGLI